MNREKIATVLPHGNGFTDAVSEIEYFRVISNTPDNNLFRKKEPITVQQICTVETLTITQVLFDQSRLRIYDIG